MANVRVTDKVKIDSEVLAITSAAGSTSLNYEMADYHKAAIVVNVSADTSATGFSTATLDLMESSAATVAGTSAAGGSAGIVVGGASTLVPAAGGVRKMTLTMTSATSLQAFNLSLGTVTKKFQYTTSTSLNADTANVSTLSYYGSTLGSTVNTGIALSITRLMAAINSTVNFGGNILCSTGTTDDCVLQVADSADGDSLGFQDSTGVMSALVNQAVGGFNIASDELTSTLNKRYVGVKISSAATACNCGVSVIRTGGRYNPPTFSGKLST